jgi:hypothetical protein
LIFTPFSDQFWSALKSEQLKYLGTYTLTKAGVLMIHDILEVTAEVYASFATIEIFSE